VDEELECSVCGARILKVDAMRSGWKAYGPPEEGEDLFQQRSSMTLSIRCNLCALGSVLVALGSDGDGDPAYEDALGHYRDALRRKEWNT
jgi:hypothetical protein